MKALYEEMGYQRGHKFIAGIDEAGRGPLAGPVVAAACIFPRGLIIPGIDDSKKLTPEKRSELFHILKEHPESDFAVGIVDNVRIDEINILQATMEAMKLAVVGLTHPPDYLLVDGNQVPDTGILSQAIIKGDSRSQIIGAASIIAKETRDALMKGYGEKWPAYGFGQHKGYGTKLHIEALEKHGPCPIHRLSFAPVRIGRTPGHY